VILETLQPSDSGRWLGQLHLAFEQQAGQTVMVHSRHSGPLRVQRPFREPNGGCQVYILNPPGGIVSGDELQVEARLGPGARTLLTTPGASKFYRSSGASARQQQELSIAAGAHLEWLPQESIVFEGARAEQATTIRLESGGSFFGWEVTCLGRPAAGDHFANGSLLQRWHLFEDGRLLWKERTALSGSDPVRHAPWGWAGRAVLGTLVAYPVSPAALDAAQQALEAASNEGPRPSDAPWASATLLDRVLVCRFLGTSSALARAKFIAVWQRLRPTEFGSPAVLPRIWAT
jgi:urease accessory protein